LGKQGNMDDELSKQCIRNKNLTNEDGEIEKYNIDSTKELEKRIKEIEKQ
jgi:hypothetical protein